MPPGEPDNERQNEPLEVRLRIEPGKVATAHAYLAEIDRTVFAAAASHAPDAHPGLIRRTVAGLFDRG